MSCGSCGSDKVRPGREGQRNGWEGGGRARGVGCRRSVARRGIKLMETVAAG